MFDIGWDEMLLTAIVAIVVIGPKDLPRALRTAGRWIGKVRRVSGHFRSGIENMIREAELEDMEKKWREQNEAIMAAHPPAASAEAALTGENPGLAALPPAADESPAATEPAPAKPKRKPRKAS
jgi:sec-independent protein translocase protein TatB